MGKERVISQVGDSTDGEDYEDDKYNSYIAILNRKYFNPYRVSSMLKDIGNQILQNPKVRSEYKKIKKKFIPAEKTSSEYKDLQKEYKNLLNLQLDSKKQLYGNLEECLKYSDTKLGRGWGILVNKYDPEDPTASEVGVANYYKINKTMIETACSTKPDYNNLPNDAGKGRYYLDNVVKIQDNFNTLYKLHKFIEKYTQKQRKDIEAITFDTEQKDASLFLAKIKASQKLDKDLGKNYLWDYKHGTGRAISKNVITKKTTQQDETVDFYKTGTFTHFKTNEGTYENIGQELKKLITRDFINEKELKNFFQSSLKGKVCSKTIKNRAVQTDLRDQLKIDVDLIFGIEVKRNPAALLTNAMFFDLVDKGIYKIEEIVNKMPMAMKGAVSASITIDKEIGKLRYDYRENPRGTKEAKELLEKDESILQDWLNLKLNISSKIERSDIANAISSLGMNDLVQKLADLNLGYIDTSKCNTRKKIQNEENIDFKFDGDIVNCKLQWDTTVMKFKVMPQIHDVKAKVFYDLILEWYGIELPYLNMSDKITLKAAAEPKDIEDNQDEDNSKVLAIDEGKLAPETEFSEYKQKDYIRDKDNFDTVLQHEHAFVQPLGEIAAISLNG